MDAVAITELPRSVVPISDPTKEKPADFFCPYIYENILPRMKLLQSILACAGISTCVSMPRLLCTFFHAL